MKKLSSTSILLILLVPHTSYAIRAVIRSASSCISSRQMQVSVSQKAIVSSAIIYRAQARGSLLTLKPKFLSLSRKLHYNRPILAEYNQKTNHSNFLRQNLEGIKKAQRDREDRSYKLLTDMLESNDPHISLNLMARYNEIIAQIKPVYAIIEKLEIELAKAEEAEIKELKIKLAKDEQTKKE